VFFSLISYSQNSIRFTIHSPFPFIILFFQPFPKKEFDFFVLGKQRFPGTRDAADKYRIIR